MLDLIFSSFQREFKLYFRKPGEWVQPIVFFIILTGLFALILGESQVSLRRLAPGMLWMCLVLGFMLSQESVFFSDKESGVLQDLLLHPHVVVCVILCKILAHTFIVGIPLLLIALLSAFLFDIELNLLPAMALSFLISFPSLSLVGGIASALTLGLKRGGLLLGILVLPLMAPVILFGCAATKAVCEGLPLLPHLALLLSVLLILLLITPIICVFALKVSAEC